MGDNSVSLPNPIDLTMPRPFRLNRTITSLMICLMGVVLCWGYLSQPVQAAHCRTLKGSKFEGKSVCIDWIKRSAKRYWEYQAVLSIDGVAQAKQTYDCRSRVIIEPDDTIISFKRNEPGSVVCDLYRERSKSMRLSDLSSPERS
jgi:hypothetical protein